MTKFLQQEVRADLDQLRGQVSSIFRQSRALGTLARDGKSRDLGTLGTLGTRTLGTLATDGTSSISMAAARPFDEMPQPKK